MLITAMLAVVTWRWGPLFSAEYVNRLHSMLARHLRVPHRLHCVTHDTAGLDRDIEVVEPPAELAQTPRCRRRMWQWDRARRADFGDRMLAIDVDVVVLDDLTPIVDRPEPIVGWRVGYAGVVSGSFLLADTGALHGAWEAYRRDPDGYPASTGERNASDQAMLNHWLRGQPRIAEWSELDGFVTWFGDTERYRALEHHGMGPGRPTPPPGARIVVMGSADKAVMDEGRYEFVRTHWR